MNRSSHHLERPRSELLVDLHVYVVPRELWVDRLHCALNQVIEETVSAGFIRVLPETRVYDLREDIEKQLGYETVPKNYVFLKSVGRCLTRVKSKQEYQMKVKHFLPPHAYCPEIFLLDPPSTMRGMSSTDDDSLRNSYTPYNKIKEPKETARVDHTPVEPDHDDIESSSSAELRTPHLLEYSDTNDENFVNNNDTNNNALGTSPKGTRRSASGTPMSATPCGSRTSFYFDLLTRKIPTTDTSSRRAKYSQETKDSGIAEDSYSDRQRQLDRDVAFMSVPLDKKISLSDEESIKPDITSNDKLKQKDVLKDADTESDDLNYHRPSRPKRKQKSMKHKPKKENVPIEQKHLDSQLDKVEISANESKTPPNSANETPAESKDNCSSAQEGDRISCNFNDRKSRSSSLHDQIKDALLTYDGSLGEPQTIKKVAVGEKDNFSDTEDNKCYENLKNHSSLQSPKRLDDEEINRILEKPVFKDLPLPNFVQAIPSINVSATNSENGADNIDNFITSTSRLESTENRNENVSLTQNNKTEFMEADVNATSSENGADDIILDSNNSPLVSASKIKVPHIISNEVVDDAASTTHSNADGGIDDCIESRPGTYTLKNPRTNTIKSRRKPEKAKKPKPRVHIAPPPKPAESPKPRISTPPPPPPQLTSPSSPYKPDPNDEDRWAEQSEDSDLPEEQEDVNAEEAEVEEQEEDNIDELEGEGRDSENRRRAEEERKRREEERRRRQKEEEERRKRQIEEEEHRRRKQTDDEERRRREQEDWVNVQRQEEEDRRRREEAERKRREEEDERRLREEKERLLREEEERKKAAATNKEEERRQLLEELEQIQKDRKEMETKREELVRRAKLLQSKTQNKRNQARDIWKKKYFEEKKKTPALEDKCNKLRIELESLHRKIVSQMETGPVKEKHSIKPMEKGGKPSQAANLRIQATKLQHEVEEMQRRVDDSKMKLTSEVKLRNQAESELRALRAELTQKKINLTLTRSQKLAALGSTTDLQQPLTSRQSIAITPKS